MAARDAICDVKLQSSECRARFTPDPINYTNGASIGMKEPDPSKGEWYNILFDARGFMMASIGIPWNDTSIPIETVFSAFYAIADLFNQEPIKECFPHVMWGSSNFGVFAKISQFPGNVIIPPFIKIESFPSTMPVRGSEWGGPHLREFMDSLKPEQIALHFTYRFLRSYGFLIEKESLQILIDLE